MLDETGVWSILRTACVLHLCELYLSFKSYAGVHNTTVSDRRKLPCVAAWVLKPNPCLFCRLFQTSHVVASMEMPILVPPKVLLFSWGERHAFHWEICQWCREQGIEFMVGLPKMCMFVNLMCFELAWLTAVLGYHDEVLRARLLTMRFSGMYHKFMIP